MLEHPFGLLQHWTRGYPFVAGHLRLDRSSGRSWSRFRTLLESSNFLHHLYKLTTAPESWTASVGTPTRHGELRSCDLLPASLPWPWIPLHESRSIRMMTFF